MARRRMRTLTKGVALLLMLVSGGIYFSTRNLYEYAVPPSQNSFLVGTIARRPRGAVPTLNPLTARSFAGDHNTIERPTISTQYYNYNNSYYYRKKSGNNVFKRSKLVDHQTTSTNPPARIDSAKTKRTSSYDRKKQP